MIMIYATIFVSFSKGNDKYGFFRKNSKLNLKINNQLIYINWKKR